MNSDDPSTGTAFVGRIGEMAELRARLEEAFAGHGALTLLSGDAGIGKTRLAEELERDARSRQAQVLWGQCDEMEGTPAFWPWIQVLRAQRRVGQESALVSELGAAGADIADLVPELRKHMPHVSRPLVLPPEQARFQLFDGLTALLGNAARKQPLLVVLEDVHWADTPSLRLLQFLVRHTHDAPLFVLATHRELEANLQHPATAVLAEFAGEPRTSRIRLNVLTEQDVARYIEVTARFRPPDALVAAVYERTEGHPFFLREVVRLLTSEGRLRDRGAATSIDIPIPRTVRGMIGQRLQRLPQECHHILSVAAVVGREFATAGLAELSDIGSDRLLEVFEPAVRARLVTPVRGCADRFRFSHALIRGTLYDDFPPPQRVKLHRQIGELLERLSEGCPDRYLSELAYHFSAAAAADAEVDKAIDYLERAGRRAVGALAYEEGARLYRTALDLAERGNMFDPRRRCKLLIELGSAHRKGGEPQEADARLREAAELARERRYPELLAEAALAFGGVEATFDLLDEYLVGLLEAALAALGDGPLRVRVLARLALELYHSPDFERRLAMSKEAVEVARRTSDAGTLAYALNARHGALLNPDHLEERLTVATELLAVARQVGDAEMTLSGHMWRLVDLLEQCDIRGVDREIEASLRLADALRQPLYVAAPLVWRSMRALLDGRLQEAEALAMRAMSAAPGVPRLISNVSVTMFILRMEQGRHGEIEPAVRAALLQSTNPVWRAGLAYLTGEMGNLDEARAELRWFADTDFAPFRRDVRWLPGLVLLAGACARVREPECAQSLYERLQPFAGRNVVVGIGAACLGPVDHYLGLLARTRERWEEAERHFATALELSAQLSARPRAADTRAAYAAMLLERGRAADRRKALELLTKALDDANRLGMARLAEECAGLQQAAARTLRVTGDELATTPAVQVRNRDSGDAIAGATQPGDVLPEVDECIFRQAGDYWTIGYEGRVIRLRDARGLHYLVQLLRQPGRELHVCDLVSGGAASGEAGVRDRDLVVVSGVGDAGEVLDAQATAAYRQRLEDLREELEEARQTNDLGRIDRASSELAMLHEQLSAAARGRKSASHSERARLAVTKGIGAAIEKITASHPALGGHLAATVRRGYFCVYRPDPRHPVTWQV